VRQVFQSLKSGEIQVLDIPNPSPRSGQLLIRTHRTVISVGTERMLVEFAKAGYLKKAQQQPEKVRQVLDKIKADGLLTTLDSVLRKLDEPMMLGYCNAGVVIGIGAGVSGFAVGDRVVSNGRHAELVSVPANLCAKIPVEVPDEEAAFTVLGSIALQGIRLIQPTLGESVVVMGLGLIGQIAVQLLRANGCRVLGLDFDPAKLALARAAGAEVVDLRETPDPVQAAMAFSRDRGVDAVLVTASTASSEPIHHAALMSRKRGRIVLVGVTGLELSRSEFYEKELTFQVSCSYGPGRYDPTYEEQGHDYPLGFVRWTEQRNFEAVLDMLRDRRLDVAPLISHRFSIAQAEQAYGVVTGKEPTLGIVLRYADASDPDTADFTAPSTRTVNLPVGAAAPATAGAPRVSVIGAGNYAGAVLIPAFKAAGACLARVASAGGASSVQVGRKFGFEQATTDTDALISDPKADVVVVATRHDSHAALTLAAQAAGKHVFVEKPLCLTLDELERIGRAFSTPGSPRLMVGFNRRFAPQVVRMKELLAATPGPKAMTMTVNAGAITATHWVQDRGTGGGRLIGEGCHFIDLLRHLAGAAIASSSVTVMNDDTRDSMSITLKFADGSIGNVHYYANGARAVPKERLEVFAAGRVLQLDNFRRLTGFGWPGFGKLNLWRQDKGQNACAAAFVAAVRDGREAPIPLDELLEVARVTLELSEQG
jgi:predicted dehydrogenase/threonine dehydrogenase-like Zn-dependent dehydrogenase